MNIYNHSTNFIKKITLLLIAIHVSLHGARQQQMERGDQAMIGTCAIVIGAFIGYKLYTSYENSWENRRTKDYQTQNHIIDKMRKKLFVMHPVKESDDRKKFLKFVDRFQQEEKYMRSVEKRYPSYFSKWFKLDESRTVLINLIKLMWLVDNFEHEESVEKILLHLNPDIKSATIAQCAIDSIQLWINQIFLIRYDLSTEEQAFFNNYYQKAHTIKKRLERYLEYQQEIAVSQDIFFKP